MAILLIAISIFVPPVWYVTVAYILYRLFTRKSRADKYYEDAQTWFTGGELSTGDVNVNKAFHLFAKASELGHAKASYFLGSMYRDGAYVPQNMSMAEMYFELSKEQCFASYNEMFMNEREIKVRANQYT
ncbi:SEL1-like repeat protein [Thalassotalea mangrovi]|uniref:Sel1 repeat family protein n=1 Tax=Thalassotalea mangrovi TaxID=2572245 RepID=A0A4U1B296_9GAMM|nr:SEL1-like repeat protein [Thalassotalea mangrovi]TKB43648.1 sel1 repeat family protein [Thalassotalea mangrovi]